MTPQEEDEFRGRIQKVFREMENLLVAKRHAYGTTNLVRFGGIGIVIRASDKIDRLANLFKVSSQKGADGETIDDAFRDLVGYGVLGLLFQEDEKNKELGQTIGRAVRRSPKLDFSGIPGVMYTGSQSESEPKPEPVPYPLND